MAPTSHERQHRPGSKTPLKWRSQKAAASLAAQARLKSEVSPNQPLLPHSYHLDASSSMASVSQYPLLLTHKKNFG